MPKLLWVSPFNLHDTSSGAAVQARLMLQKLAQRGVSVRVLGSFCFDSMAGAKSHFPKLEEEMKESSKKSALNFNQNGIDYTYLPCASINMGEMTHDESWKLFSRFCSMLSTFRPDVCMGYGMGCLGTAIHAECRRRAIPHAYPIFNGNHPYYNFFDSDLLFTDSDANAHLYGMRDRLNLATTGIFVNKEDYVADEKDKTAEYITMINPEPRKGGGIFAKIALIAQKDPELKNEKFLCVNSRGHFSATINALKDSKGKGLEATMFENVQMAENTRNMKGIYAMTKLLLAPSVPNFWYEGWGRVASEAVLNRIPVLVAKNGGLEQAMAGAGIALDVPKSVNEDMLALPSDDEIKPWVDALKKLLKDKKAGAMEQAFDEAEKALDIERSTDRAMEMLAPLFAKKASQNPHLFINGNLRLDISGNIK